MASRIALTLHPPRPMTRLITDDGTDSFFDLEMVLKNIMVLCSVECFGVVCFGMV